MHDPCGMRPRQRVDDLDGVAEGLAESQAASDAANLLDDAEALRLLVRHESPTP